MAPVIQPVKGGYIIVGTQDEEVDVTEENPKIEALPTNGHGEFLPDPIVSTKDIVASLQAAEIAVRQSIEMLMVAVARACATDQMQQAAVWDARATLLRQSAHMLGLCAIDVRQVLP